jgi:predicted DNA-binding transcriptional regulator AlpA
MLNENQVAQQLGVSIATVRRWRAQNTGPIFRKLGGGAAVRYSSEDLERWVESQPKGGDSESAVRR